MRPGLALHSYSAAVLGHSVARTRRPLRRVGTTGDAIACASQIPVQGLDAPRDDSRLHLPELISGTGT